jgi:hypothetical protein
VVAHVFSSNAEFFDALTKLIVELRNAAHPAAAAELEGGFRCLNGLTDGWALLLESIRRVEETHATEFTTEQRCTLADLRTAAHSLVYRH